MAEMLVQFLNEVLGACWNIGLHFVATVLDMGTNNVKAMKLLGSARSELSSSFKIKQLHQYMTLQTS
jgi:hypothetical protein